MMRGPTLLLVAATTIPFSSTLAQSTASADAGDIVVTAQKTSQRAQDVPLSVSTIAGKDLTRSGATSMRDIAATIPGLQVDSSYGVPGAYNLTLRGINTGQQQSATVATYIDDVPVGSSGNFALYGTSGLDLLPYDLDHVEVLEGPQGTLYGASSMGGLLKYVTRTPSLHQNSYDFGGDLLGISHGSKAGWAIRGAADIVVLPGELSLSISGAHQYTPGFIDDITTGNKTINHGTQEGARAVLYWEPSSKFSLKLTGLYNRLNFKGLGNVDAALDGAPIHGEYKTSAVEDGSQESTTKLASATANYDFDFAKVVSVTSYSDQRARQSYDGTPLVGHFFGVNSPVNSYVPIKKFTQEVRLSSPAKNRFHWLIGAFYTHEKTLFDQHVPAYLPGTQTPVPGLDPLLIGDIYSKYREWAIFANGTLRITDAWDVSGGVRYSKNRQSIQEIVSGVLTGGASVTAAHSTDDDITFSVSSSYHFMPNVMVYVRAASGYRPGGPNFVIPGIRPSFDPDTLINYEAGLKSELFDRRLLLNISAFYIDWHKIQLNGQAPNGLGYLANGGNATSKGIELTTNLRVSRQLTIGGSLAYTDAKLKDPVPVLSGAAGDQLPSTPRWASSITADYTARVGDHMQAHVGAVWRYTGPRNELFPASPLFHHLGSYNTINATAGVSQGAVALNLFIRNLTNKYAYSSWYGYSGPVVIQPRTVGLSLDVKLH